MLKNQKRLNRERAPRLLRRFCPDYHVRSIMDVDPSDLVSAGVKAALLDLDNTLLPWKGGELPDETIQWVQAAKSANLKLCLLSNTRNLERLQSLANRLGVPFVRGRMKPARSGFRLALQELGTSASETVMIGDQMFTDVWGGNRMGMCTILVHPMHRREFIGTKVSRFAERLLTQWLKRAREQ